MFSTPRCASSLISILFFFLFGVHSQAQIVVNEICPSNINLIRNSNGEYDDWIELYNSSLVSHVDLDDWGLSNDPSYPYLFRFPDVELYPGQRLLVFASDFTKTKIVDHWEGTVGVADWKYYSQSTAPDTNWRNPGFSDSWSVSDAPFGFSGAVPISTAINSSSMAIAMRKVFYVNDPSDVIQAVLHVDYDDGFVAFLNGVEIARSNLGVVGQRPAWNLPANTSHSPALPNSLPDSFQLSSGLIQSLIVQGQNVLAIEVHNKLSSNDLVANAFLTLGISSSVQPGNPPAPPSWFALPENDHYVAPFRLPRSGGSIILTDDQGNIVDQRTYNSLVSDNSVGCVPDGNISNWCTFSTPTPDSTNGNAVCYSGYASMPVFSLPPGFHNGTQLLEVMTAPPGEIRYTTNGDEPGFQSALYSTPVIIDRSMVVRARVFSPGLLPGPIVTNNYFIDEDLRLPVFTINTDSLNLWDQQSGIYVLGPNASSTYPYQGANFWQDWRKPASISFYDRQRNKVMEFDAEISIYGNYSRAKPQKSMEINLSDRFGTGEVAHQFFGDKPFLDETDNIVLRNSGTDWNRVHFRDAFIERVMKNTFSGYLASEPADLFLNGEYWGVYTIHENHDHHWMKYNFGYDKDEIDYLKEDGSTVSVKAGTDIAWWDMYNFAVNEDPTTNAYYVHMDNVLDLKNFADYFIVETYINNDDWIGDWTNNIKMWRPDFPGGKFRYLLYDTDMGFGYGGLSPYQNRLTKALDPAAFSHSSELFDHITDNPTFRNYFINRYADLINTIYKPSNLDAVMNSLRDSMSHDMPEHWQQWGGSLSSWNGYVSDMQSFYNNRPAAARNHIESAFQLTDQETLTLQTNPTGAGRIQISTVIPESYPWTGVYFQGNPVKLTAIPNPGYEFTRWSSIDLGTNDTNIVTEADFTTNQTITAFFTGSLQIPQVEVSEINYNSSTVSDAGDWIELKNSATYPLDISGWKLYDESDFHQYIFPVGTTIPPNGYLVIAEDLELFRMVYPSVTNVKGPIGFGFSNSGDRIRLTDYRDSGITSFYYSDSSPWPEEADGNGYTCERVFPTTDPNLGSSWFPGCLGGSPGGLYGSTSGLPVQISGSSTYCAGATAELEATFRTGYAYQWYLDSVLLVGETGISITANLPGNYSVRTSFQGCTSESVQFNLSEVLAGPEPIVTYAYRCDPGPLTLIAQSTDSVYWFDAPGGQLIFSGDTFLTPLLNTSVTYYAQTSLYCPSNAVPVTAEILRPSTAPIAIDRVLCGPGSISLSVIDTSDITRWYNAPVAGALVATGDTFDLAYIGNDTTFYIESGSACPSSRTVMNVQVVESSTPAAENVTRCGSGQVVLQAISPDPVRWLNAASGGSLLSISPVFSPTVNSSTVYYLQSVGTCQSAPVPVVVTVLPVPDPPTINDTSLCAPASLDLFASSPEQVYWFSGLTDQTPFFTGPTFTTPLIDTTVTYFIETGYVCRSSTRVPVTIEVNIPPAIDLGNDTAIVSGDTVLLEAPAGFDFYMWSTGSQGQQLTVTQAGTYVVTGITNDGCSVTDMIEISILTGDVETSGAVFLGIYPNPSNDRTLLSFFHVSSALVSIKISDVSGRTVLEHDLQTVSGVNKAEFNVSALASGSYLVSIVESGRAVAMKRLAITR